MTRTFSPVAAIIIAARFVVCIASATPVAAQTTGSPRSNVVITGRDLGILGGSVIGAAALSLFDVRIARAFADSTLHTQAHFQAAAKGTSSVTETLLMITGASVWAVARIGSSDGVADVALHTAESVASGAMVIQVIRGVAGRARPYVVDDSGKIHDADPYNFKFLKGFTSFNYRSFPSMHAMASFAAATALSQEMRERHTPHRGVLSPLLYVGASASPAARLYLDEHWASDIALGAFLGVFAGQKVVTYSHEHPGNLIDRHLLKPEMRAGVTLDARGVSLRVTPF